MKYSYIIHKPKRLALYKRAVIVAILQRHHYPPAPGRPHRPWQCALWPRVARSQSAPEVRDGRMGMVGVPYFAKLVHRFLWISDRYNT